MAALSDYSENLVLNVLLRAQSHTGAAQTYISLHTTNPTDTGTGAEASYTNYARRSVTWVAPANGVTSNTAQIDFPSNGSAGSVTITHVGVWDALNAGNMLFHTALTSSKTLQPGDVLSFAANAMQITLA
jgi:hypothetical protein